MQVGQSKKYSGGWLVHLTAWAVIIGMPLFVTGTDKPLFNGADYLRFLIVPVSFMILFYINFFYLIEHYLFSHKITHFLFLNIVLIGVVMLLVDFMFHTMIPPARMEGPPPPATWRNTLGFSAKNAVLYILVVGASVAIRMTGSWYRTEAARKELEHIHTQAELQNLKSQLNPHFLFNTLNNIYSLIAIDAQRAQRAVHDLSRMLRYVLYESSKPTVCIKEEIKFLHDYIELMRIRLPGHVKLDINLPEDPPPIEITPLLFISPIENAFKHGVSHELASYIKIDMVVDEDRVACDIKNSAFPKPVEGDRVGHGIGLQNLEKRLEMSYPGRYSFDYGMVGEGEYRACLEIEIK